MTILGLVAATACNGDESDPSRSQRQAVVSVDEDGKVTICHVPPGNPENAHTIRVDAAAVPAHLAHGDLLGPCDPSDCDDAGNCGGGDACDGGAGGCDGGCEGGGACDGGDGGGDEDDDDGHDDGAGGCPNAAPPGL